MHAIDFFVRSRLLQTNPLLGKLADSARGWDDKWDTKKDSILQTASAWWDKIQQGIAGNMGDLGGLFHGLADGEFNPEALKMLGISADTAASGLAPLFGLDNTDEMKALMDGLHEAGFQDLMKDFLMQRRRRKA
jgi:hypothetical protein